MIAPGPLPPYVPPTAEDEATMALGWEELHQRVCAIERRIRRWECEVGYNVRLAGALRQGRPPRIEALYAEKQRLRALADRQLLRDCGREECYRK